MPRIDVVSDAQAGPLVRLAYHFTARDLAKVSDRAGEGMLDPLRLYAHVPGLLRGYGGLERATAKLTGLDKRLRALAELKAATLIACEYCIDLGSQIARDWGLTDAELLALADYRASGLFTELDRLVLDYAVGMCRTPVDVSDELVTALRARLSDAEIVELTHVIALENLRGRFNRALGVDPAGFSDGMVCAIPQRPGSAGSGSESARSNDQRENSDGEKS
jgi:AhpD family alkylhydroperoxidase